MNYEYIYNQLCQRSIGRTWEPFKYEKHHIIPKSLGGSNAKSNLAILTPREHALAHLLLVRFLTGEHKAKMITAINAMIGYRNKHRQAISTRQYETLRVTYYKLRQTPEYRAMKSAATAKQWTPERRAKQSAITKQQWSDPNSAKRESFSSQEYSSLKSQQMKDRWKDPNYIQEQSEQAVAQWKSGAKAWGR
jgi:hypothetical protein